MELDEYEIEYFDIEDGEKVCLSIFLNNEMENQLILTRDMAIKLAYDLLVLVGENDDTSA